MERGEVEGKEERGNRGAHASNEVFDGGQEIRGLVRLRHGDGVNEPD